MKSKDLSHSGEKNHMAKMSHNKRQLWIYMTEDGKKAVRLYIADTRKRSHVRCENKKQREREKERDKNKLKL